MPPIHSRVAGIDLEAVSSAAMREESPTPMPNEGMRAISAICSASASSMAALASAAMGGLGNLVGGNYTPVAPPAQRITDMNGSGLAGLGALASLAPSVASRADDTEEVSEEASEEATEAVADAADDAVSGVETPSDAPVEAPVADAPAEVAADAAPVETASEEVEAPSEEEPRRRRRARHHEETPADPPVGPVAEVVGPDPVVPGVVADPEVPDGGGGSTVMVGDVPFLVPGGTDFPSVSADPIDFSGALGSFGSGDTPVLMAGDGVIPSLDPGPL